MISPNRHRDASVRIADDTAEAQAMLPRTPPDVRVATIRLGKE